MTSDEFVLWLQGYLHGSRDKDAGLIVEDIKEQFEKVKKYQDSTKLSACRL